MSKFTKLCFKSKDEHEIIIAVKLLTKLGYHAHDQYFNTEESTLTGGLCAWDDGELTEGWLDISDGFKQVTLEDLKEMVDVSTNNKVLWLNKSTLEEKYLEPCFGYFYDSLWVEVPYGATFATGDKDNFVFRKDGWYYDDQKGVWVSGDVNLRELDKHDFVKLFWVKSDIKENVFTLERLLGCEVLFHGDVYWVNDVYCINQDCHLVLENDSRRAYVSDLKLLTFFTEDGDELTFDEYVEMYYGEQHEFN